MKDKVVIITGATSGIGLASAKEFYKRGAFLVLTGRRKEVLEENLKYFKDLSKVLNIVMDVVNEDDNIRMVYETVKKFGKIDVLICNAGISMRAAINDTKVSVIKQVMDTNFYGSVYAVKHTLPYILNSKGSIVGISSIAGIVGLPLRTGYSASKFALNGFLESVRSENKHNNISVSIICPGFTQSEIRKNSLNQKGEKQLESPRDEEKMMSSEEVAYEIYLAIKKRKKFVVLTTQGKLVYWLNKFLPGLVQRLVYRSVYLKEHGK